MFLPLTDSDNAAPGGGIVFGEVCLIRLPGLGIFGGDPDRSWAVLVVDAVHCFHEALLPIIPGRCIVGEQEQFFLG